MLLNQYHFSYINILIVGQDPIYREVNAQLVKLYFMDVFPNTLAALSSGNVCFTFCLNDLHIPSESAIALTQPERALVVDAVKIEEILLLLPDFLCAFSLVGV
jgi:hypothetical protein